MHKDTLANIVIKAVRQANSVIDSSYEFPEVEIRTNEEIAFRDNVLKYCNACHDNGKEEQRAAYTQNILEYAAALQVEDYGKKLPELIKSIKRCKISTWAGIGLSYAGIIASSSTSVIAVSIFGVLSGFKNQAYDLIWKRIHGQPLEKKLIDEYYEHSLQEDFAKELKQATQKEFNDAIFEHWDELTTALEDVSEKETKRLLGKKSWE